MSEENVKAPETSAAPQAPSAPAAGGPTGGGRPGGRPGGGPGGPGGDEQMASFKNLMTNLGTALSSNDITSAQSALSTFTKGMDAGAIVSTTA